MTRLVTCGWETGDVNEAGSVFGGATQAVATATPTPRTPGTYCLKFNSGGGGGTSSRGFNLGSNKTDVWVRFGIFVHGTTAQVDILNFFDSAVAVQTEITWTSSDQLLRVYRGGTAGTLLGTSVLQMTPEVWHALEVRWQASSTTVGTVEVWVDDTRWLNLTGVDNTNTANANILWVYPGASFIGIASATYIAVDDLAINDTAGSVNNGRIGDGRVVLLKPNGAGSNTGQTRGGTDTGANWSQTNELPPSMTQYVLGATAALRDTYALQDVPSGSWTVNCCEVLALALNSDTGTGSLGLTVKSGATTNEGTAQNLTTTAAYYRQLYETDPATSAAWTVAAVSALEAGTTVR